MKHILFTTALLMAASLTKGLAQDMSYKEPPKAIKEIALAKMPPSVLVSGDGKWLLELDDVPSLSVEELAKPEYKL